MRRRGVVRQDAGPEEEIRKLVQLGRANTQSCRGHVPLNGGERPEPRAFELLGPVHIKPLAVASVAYDEVFHNGKQWMAYRWMEERHLSLDDLNDIRTNSCWDPGGTRPCRRGVLTAEGAVSAVPVEVQSPLRDLVVTTAPRIGARSCFCAVALAAVQMLVLRCWV